MIMLTQVGLSLPVLMMPARMVKQSMSAAPFEPWGHYSATATCVDIYMDGEAVECLYNVLDCKISRQSNRWSGASKSNVIVWVFGVLNITETATVKVLGHL